MFRLQRFVEIELAKFLATIGFADYGKLLWDIAKAKSVRPASMPDGVAPEILRQIMDQARHDPSVLAVGKRAIRHIGQTDRNLKNIWGVSAADLLDGIDLPVSAIFAVATLDEKTMRQLVAILECMYLLGPKSCLVVVTDQSRNETFAPAVNEIRGAKILFWSEHFVGEGAASPRFFANFIHVLGAPLLVSFASAVALEAMAQFGAALRVFQRLFAIFNVPQNEGEGFFTEVYHLRQTASHATTLAFSEREAALLKSNATGLADYDIQVISPRTLASHDKLQAIFGGDLDDARSQLSKAVIGRLLEGRQSYAPELLNAPVAHTVDCDVTVTIVFHGEKHLSVPALASLADMINVAKNAGLKIEARAMLDNADDLTACLIQEYGWFLDDIQKVSFGDLGLTRNAGAALARGRYLTFLDGDDLWGADWVLQSYRAATTDCAPNVAIWHPTCYFVFLASDCERSSETDVPDQDSLSRIYYHQPSDADAFDPRDLLLESLWTANAFALTDIFRRYEYRRNDWTKQVGIEDWRWNLETLSAGIPHLVVPGTVHIIREKDKGSLSQINESRGLLPIFT